MFRILIFSSVMLFACTFISNAQDNNEFKLDFCDLNPPPIGTKECGPRGANQEEESFDINKSPRTFENVLDFRIGNSTMLRDKKVEKLKDHIENNSYSLQFSIQFSKSDNVSAPAKNFKIDLGSISIEFLYHQNNYYVAYNPNSNNLINEEDLSLLNSQEFKIYKLHIADFTKWYTFIIQATYLDDEVLLKDFRYTSKKYDSNTEKNDLIPLYTNGTDYKITDDITFNITELKLDYKLLNPSHKIEKLNQESQNIKFKNFKIINLNNSKSFDQPNSFSKTTNLASIIKENFKEKKINISFFSICNSEYINQPYKKLGDSPAKDRKQIKAFFGQNNFIDSAIELNNLRRDNFNSYDKNVLSELFPLNKCKDVNFIHFSGHGIIHNNKSYWLPIDFSNANISYSDSKNMNNQNQIGNQREIEIMKNAICIESLINYLDTLGGGGKIFYIISDACRDSIDKRSGTGKIIKFKSNISDSTKSNRSLVIVGYPGPEFIQTSNNNTYSTNLIKQWSNNINYFTDRRMTDIFHITWENDGEHTRSAFHIDGNEFWRNDIELNHWKFIEIHKLLNQK